MDFSVGLNKGAVAVVSAVRGPAPVSYQRLRPRTIPNPDSPRSQGFLSVPGLA